MQDYKKQFIDLALRHQVLKFGDFTLKSGRQSPYFFNAGLFDTGAALAELGKCYAQALVESKIDYDMLFGPAYKGIPLVSVLAASLYDGYQLDKPYAFNRKEIKDHGEGGQIVGSELRGKVIVIDDVITAGTAIRESIDIIESGGASCCGVLIALDRQETGQSGISAVQEVSQDYGVRVLSIITMSDLIDYLKIEPSNQDDLKALMAYRDQYGI